MKVGFTIWRSPTVTEYVRLNVHLDRRITEKDPIFTAIRNADGVEHASVWTLDGSAKYEVEVRVGKLFSFDDAQCNIVRALRNLFENVEVAEVQSA